MAEYVHQTLEEMIPELEEMSRLGLFTVKETKVILKNREKHEYKLRQLTKTKAMFLNYVEYEKKLLELLKFRRKRLGQDSKKRDIEKSIADRIHKLFRLLTTRFPEDVSLWEQHIDFTKHMNEKAYVTRLYKQVLKIHSHKQDLWVKSAQWESSREGNSNPELAREILLKGQRVNPESEVIILEMYHMELSQAKQVLKRKAILGIPSQEGGEGEDMASSTDGQTAELKLAEIVYRKGTELFPENPDFHLKLLNVCSWFKEASSLQKKIVNDLQHDYPDTPSVWNGLALHHLFNVKKMAPEQKLRAVQKCLTVYKQAVARLPTEEMWSLCLRGHLAVLDMLDNKRAQSVLRATLAMFEQAQQQGMLTESLYLQLLELLADLGMTEDVKCVSVKATEQHPESPKLWLARFRSLCDGGLGEGAELRKMLKTALTTVSAEKSWCLWEFVLNYLASCGGDDLEELMETACRSVSREVCIPAKEWSIHWTYRQGGLKAVRSVYSRMKRMRPVSVEFYRFYVSIECSQVDLDLQLIRAAFEEALAEFGQSQPDVWLNYMQMERDVAKDVSRSALIQQRALTGLDSHLKETFIRKQVMYGLAG